MLCCGKSKKNFTCEVVLLDSNHVTFSRNQNVKITSRASVIFQAVCQHLNLIETDYFGLKYFDNQSRVHWLELSIPLCEDEYFMNVAGPSSLLYFGVKFYAADPCALKEEVTRYQFFLQLKEDIFSAKLSCALKKAAELSALALQSEIGDYHEGEHKPGYVSEFRFIHSQDERFEAEVAKLHTGFRGLVPATAELQYLRKCRQLDMYGVELHPVKGEVGVQYKLGISPRGIEMFKNMCRMSVYYWPRIELVDYKDSTLKLKVKNRQGVESMHKYAAKTNEDCRLLWKSIVEQHVFYRLPQNIPNTTWSKKYRYSGRTEAELLQSEVEREEPEVFRGSSKRYPPRASTDKINQAEDGTLIIDNNTGNKTDDEKMERNSNWDELNQKKGMFSVSDVEQNTSIKYMTPKNERRERNRQLQTLSDSENRHRKHRTHRGRSSGEESDSPSKRRIRNRARQHRQSQASDASEVSHRRRRRRQYHTDTEMMNGNVVLNQERVKRRTQNNNINQQSESKAQRKNKRLSREDDKARQQLWQHIKKEIVDPSDNSPEQLHDIMYTEVKTEGSSKPLRLRHHRRRNSGASKRTSAASGISHTLDDGMVSPLPITTTVMQERKRLNGNKYHPHHSTPNNGSTYNTPSKHKSPGSDWDTRTSLSVEGFQSISSNKLNKSRTRKTTPESHRKKDSGLKLVYTQI
ncbi:band 4.1-like protein 4 isoform X1 [Ciona intestinalis]